MFKLVPFMIEKIGIIIVVAFLLSQLRSFRQIIRHEHNNKDKFLLILLFGGFGVISNYTGIEVLHSRISEVGWRSSIDPEAAIANTRVLGAVIGGLIGGPIVGIGSALISGVHRYFLGGFTAFACSLSTLIAGVTAGTLGNWRKKKGKSIPVHFAVLIGMVMESLEMLIILLLARPFDQALELVKLISFPMIVINGLGMMLFMLIIQHIVREEDRTRAVQIDKAFSIAEKTLPYLKEGLNVDSSRKIARVILDMIDADAVAITDHEMILAHVGAGADHHTPFLKPETQLTKRVLKSGQIEVARTKDEIGCCHHSCPLKGAVVIPLKVKEKVAGTLKIYYKNERKIDTVQEHLVYGLGELISTQLELSEAEKQTKLLKDAEIKALQAQIQPHFLFNSLNTISALCRTNPEKARRLLSDLATFFRGNLQGARNVFCTLEQEIETVRAYVALVQARFPDKFRFRFHIEPNLEQCIVPPFILQPLVDNAVKYGFPGRKQKGDIIIRVNTEKNQLKISVTDHGMGIPEEKLKMLGKQVVPSKKGNGTGLLNISERLKGLYKEKANFKIHSIVGQGTTVSISLPVRLKEREAVV